MIEFRWTTPAPTSTPVVLRLQGRGGWYARKTLTVGNTLAFQRGRLEGIEARINVPGDPEPLILTTTCRGAEGRWHPSLLRGNQELQEENGTIPPAVAVRPPMVSRVVGITYLLMLMSVVAVPSIATILDALYLRYDDRRMILHVLPADEQPGELTIVPHEPHDEQSPTIADQSLSPAVTGQSYHHTLSVNGGQQPYHWQVSGLPAGMKFDPENASIDGIAEEPGEFQVKLRVTGASHSSAAVISPWTVPFVVAGVCMLGYWNMRRWGVVVWIAALLLQGIATVAGVLPIPATAIVLQLAGCLFGLYYWKKMSDSSGVTS